MRTSKHTLLDRAKDNEYKTEQRLKGSIRRINYAVEEKKKVDKKHITLSLMINIPSLFYYVNDSIRYYIFVLFS